MGRRRTRNILHALRAQNPFHLSAFHSMKERHWQFSGNITRRHSTGSSTPEFNAASVIPRAARHGTARRGVARRYGARQVVRVRKSVGSFVCMSTVGAFVAASINYPASRLSRSSALTHNQTHRLIRTRMQTVSWTRRRADGQTDGRTRMESNNKFIPVCCNHPTEWCYLGGVPPAQDPRAG